MNSNKKILILFVIAMIISTVANTSVYAEESVNGRTIVNADKVLNVNASRMDGVSIIPKADEVIYTKEAINYKINMDYDRDVFEYKIGEAGNNEKIDKLLETYIRSEYSMSTDLGNTYNGWNEFSNGEFSIDMANMKDGVYYIKFRKLEEYIEKSVPGSFDSPDSVSNNITDVGGLNGSERKILDKVLKKEPCHSIESIPYIVHIDTVAPAVELSSDYDFESWTNKNVKCKVKMNDTGSRLKDLKVMCDDTSVLENSFSKEDIFTGCEKEFTINTESTSVNGSNLVVWVEDMAGNVSVVEKQVRIDKTSPEIMLDGAENGKVYRNPVDVRAIGDDFSPSTVAVSYSIKRILNGEETQTENSAKMLDELNESPLFKPGEDGDYVVECVARDLAGNTSKVSKLSFRVDGTAPTIGFGGMEDGIRINSDGELYIYASDNFENSYNVKLTGSITTSKGTNALNLAEFRTEGKETVNKYYFNADGIYSVNAYVEDSAGNSNESVITFAIDKVAPKITVSKGINIGKSLVTNTPPTIGFKIEEDNYDTANVVCELKRKTDKDVYETISRPEWIMDDVASDFSIDIAEEGTYELRVSAVDAAGNTAGKTVSFTLDMTSPDIDYVENLDRKYVKNFKLPENFNEYITDQTNVSYQTYLNSKNFDEATEVSEDGKYILKVSAVDDAGNQSEKTIEFIVDGTMPRVVVEGMDDDGNVNKDEPLVLSLYDEEDFFTSVKINGVEQLASDRQNSVILNIPDYGEYSIEVIASDMAENVLTQTIEAKCANASPVEKGVTTVKTLKQSESKGSNKALRIILICLSVLVLAGSVTVFGIYMIKQQD